MDDPFPFPAALFCSSAPARRPAVIISACLEGQPVRYDATAKRLAGLPALAAALTLAPHCPEVAAGLGLPRPPVQLVAIDNAADGIRALGRDDPRLDVTAALVAHAEAEAQTLLARVPPASGYLWKSRSPSCGLGSTPVWQGGLPNAEQPTASAPLAQLGVGDGLHAAAIRRVLPWLVMAEETAMASRLAQARFVLACRLVAAALDPATDLVELCSAQTGLWATAAGTRDHVRCCAQTQDRHGYARVSGAAVMAGTEESVERLLAQCAGEGDR